MTKLVCVHGWAGSPDIGFWPWLRDEATKLGLEVHAPQLPGNENPKLVEWVKIIESLVKDNQSETILIGHSLGCDAVLRYVERQPKTTKIKAIILIAPFIDETDLKDLEEFHGQHIDVERVKLVAHQKIAFFSSNDKHVPLIESIEYQHRIGSQVHILKNRGHFRDDDGCKQIPEVLETIKKCVEQDSNLRTH